MAALAAIWLAMLLLGGGPIGFHLLQQVNLSPLPMLADATRLFTHLGNVKVLVPVTLAAAAWLAWNGRKLAALILVDSTLAARSLVGLQKVEFGRARPDPDLWLMHVQSMAFPSGHAANSILVYTLCAILVAPPRWRTIAVVAALALSISVGLSRLLLGVHWPSDVIGGWAFGLFWLFGSLMILGRRGEPPRVTRVRIQNAQERVQREGLNQNAG